jgi:hypothetical protein
MDANSLEKLNYELDRDADLREVNLTYLPVQHSIFNTTLSPHF